MNNSLQGTIQTNATCWFHSILNGFLMSNDGYKILYAKMVEFKNSLPPKEQLLFPGAHYNSRTCPLGRNVKPLFFWKFLDQYMGTMCGKRVIPVQSRNALKLVETNNINFPFKVNRNSGGHPELNILPILDRLGFKGEYNIIGSEHAILKNKIKSWVNRRLVKNPKFIISYDYYDPRSLNSTKYKLMCCSINIHCLINCDSRDSIHKHHAISGIIYNHKPYLVDPNFAKLIPCRWWNKKNLWETVNNQISKPYKARGGHGYHSADIAYSVYARREYVSGISPSCKRFIKKPGNILMTPAFPNVKLSIRPRITTFKRKPPTNRHQVSANSRNNLRLQSV